MITARIEYTCVNGIFVRHVLGKNPREAIFAELAERDDSSNPSTEWVGNVERLTISTVPIYGHGDVVYFLFAINSFEEIRRCEILLRPFYLNRGIRCICNFNITLFYKCISVVRYNEFFMIQAVNLYVNLRKI